METKDFIVGQAVKLHPATDLFMRGVRYGQVVKVGRLYVYIYTTALGTIKVHPRNIEHV